MPGRRTENDPTPEPRAGILAGATASGKTALAVELASRLPIEVISADSRQVYRHLDIGTAKPTAAERTAVVHHLVDFLELDASYNAARFAADALQLCAQIRARGKVPVVVGGAGFYLKVLREGLFEAPFSPAELQRVRQEVAGWSTEAMQRELAARDPERLAAIHPNDRYRLSRALEICLAAGKSVSQLTAEHRASADTFVEFRLTLARPHLHERIAQRTRRMLAGGWIDEVEQLLGSFDPELPGLQTLGYPLVVAHLKGEIDREQLAEQVMRDTRRYARQQEIWFRKMQAAESLELEAGEAHNAQRMERALREAFRL